jgi:hypothetical protein
MGIMRELPCQTTEINTVKNDMENENITPVQDSQADSQNLNNEKETEVAKEI